MKVKSKQPSHSSSLKYKVALNENILTSEEHVHPLHDIIAVRVVRSLLARYFQDSRHHCVVAIHEVTNFIRDLKDEGDVDKMGER